MRWKVVALIALAAVFSVIGYFLSTRATIVTVVEARRGPAVEAVYATGIIEPVRWTRVSPTVTARLVDIRVDEGMTVEKDAVLAMLDDEEIQALLAEKTARFEFLAGELSRYERLKAKDFASQARYEAVLSDYTQAAAAVEAVKRRLAEYTIRAPMDGIVLERDGEKGEVIAPGHVLFWIGKTWPLKVAAEVDEEDIPRVREGQVALIKADAFPGQVFEGEVGEITPKGDPVSKNYKVEITLPADHRLMIGMTTEVNVVVVRRPQAVLVPPQALDGGAVWIVVDGRADRRDVDVGIVGSDWVEILSGVVEGDVVILDPPRDLVPREIVDAVWAPDVDSP